jgi:hypothetical protein
LKQFFLFLFSLPLLLHAQRESDVTRLFLSLPDSVFTKGTIAFAENDSFPVYERRKMLAAYRSGIHEFSSDTVRFAIQSIDDSSNTLLFSDMGERRITFALLQEKTRSAFVCVMAEECDFVMCTQRWNFYTVNSKKVVAEKSALPTCLPPELFFRKTYLDSLGNAAPPCVDGLEYHFGKSPGLLYAHINSDFFDPELFGEESPMTKMSADGFRRNELQLRLKGKKFVVID